MKPQVGDVILILNNDNPYGKILERDIGKIAIIAHIGLPGNRIVIQKNQLGFEWTFALRNIQVIGRKDANGRFRLHGRFHSENLEDIQRYVDANRFKYKPVKEKGKAIAPKPILEEGKFNKAKQEAIAALKEWDVGLCAYVSVDKTGCINKQVGDVCHARMKEAHFAADALHYKFNNLNEEDKKTMLEMVDWIANRSHFSAAFLTKDANFIVTEYVEWDTNQPLWLVFSAAVALRGFHEFKQQIASWKAFKKAGVEEKYLWVVSLLFDHEGGYTGTTDGHRTWSSNIDYMKFKKWFHEGYNKTLFRTPMKEGGIRAAYGPIAGRLLSFYYEESDDSLNKRIKAKLKGEKKGPFGGEVLNDIPPKEMNAFIKEILG